MIGGADMARNSLFKQEIQNKMISTKSGQDSRENEDEEEEDKSKKPNKEKKYLQRDYELLEHIEKLYNDKTIPITTDIMNEIFKGQGIVITEDDINLFETCEYHDIDLSSSDYRAKIILAPLGAVITAPRDRRKNRVTKRSIYMDFKM